MRLCRATVEVFDHPRRDDTVLGRVLYWMSREPIFCNEPATHESISGDRCDACAEKLRQAMRNPNTVMNMLAGGARTEAQIARMVRVIGVEPPTTCLGCGSDFRFVGGECTAGYCHHCGCEASMEGACDSSDPV